MKKLYLCSSPIGNLNDVSFRLLDTLKKVDLILAENPNITIKLLNFYNIKKRMIKFHDSDLSIYNQNLNGNINMKLMKIFSEVDEVAYISSAGTPNLEDPPVNLVNYCYKNSIEIDVIVGPSALTAALSASPFYHTPFIFLGFLPKKLNQIKKIINHIKEYFSSDVIKSAIFFESPYRINESLNIFKDYFFDNYVLIAHELTKINQKFILKKLKDIDNLINKGEYTVILYNKD
ncbi:MAG: 16S rRNA (cytidine(1402)-2'-O)-methyltransferase [bacterium]|nr:16S rRNA (cytidine(1402)-2'-O)-methyltransferase [bacterium]